MKKEQSFDFLGIDGGRGHCYVYHVKRLLQLLIDHPAWSRRLTGHHGWCAFEIERCHQADFWFVGRADFGDRLGNVIF